MIDIIFLGKINPKWGFIINLKYIVKLKSIYIIWVIRNKIKYNF